MENSNAYMGRQKARGAPGVSWTDDRWEIRDGGVVSYSAILASDTMMADQYTRQSQKCGNLDSYVKSPIYKY